MLWQNMRQKSVHKKKKLVCLNVCACACVSLSVCVCVGRCVCESACAYVRVCMPMICHCSKYAYDIFIFSLN